MFFILTVATFIDIFQDYTNNLTAVEYRKGITANIEQNQNLSLAVIDKLNSTTLKIDKHIDSVSDHAKLLQQHALNQTITNTTLIPS